MLTPNLAGYLFQDVDDFTILLDARLRLDMLEVQIDEAALNPYKILGPIKLRVNFNLGIRQLYFALKGLKFHFFRVDDVVQDLFVDGEGVLFVLEGLDWFYLFDQVKGRKRSDKLSKFVIIIGYDLVM